MASPFVSTEKVSLTKVRILSLPTAYVVRREGYVLTRVCLSVDTWGGTPARSSRGGTPGGVPQWGVPHLGYPPVEPGRGYPDCGGYLTSGSPPPSDLARKGLPRWGVRRGRYASCVHAGGLSCCFCLHFLPYDYKTG